MTRSACVSLLCVVAHFISTPIPVFSATLNWDGGSGNWNDSNWEGSGPPPAAGDHAVISSGAVIITNSSPPLGSLRLNGGNLVCSNWSTKVSATNIWVQSTSEITMPAAFDETAGASNRVWLACEYLFVDTSASINAYGLGYKGGSSGAGYGPGKASATRAGAGHGGNGGNYTLINTFGKQHDSLIAPLAPGSGGGSGSIAGGHGGGAIRIDAAGGTVIVNGTITADGQDRASYCGGGSGGAIYIICDVFGGTNGLVAADGGSIGHNNMGAGGGGRIAIIYDTGAQAAATPSTVTLSAKYGMFGAGFSAWPAEHGTIYVPDNQLLASPLSHKGNWYSGDSIWAVDSLTCNGSWLQLATDGMTVTVTNDLVITGSATRFGLGGGSWKAQKQASFSTNDTLFELHVGGNLIVTNSGRLDIFATPTNGSSYGALIAVTGDIYVASGSGVYLASHPTNGGPSKITASNVIVRSGGIISAEGMGYWGGDKPSGGKSHYGWGPGAGPGDPTTASGHGGGAGHGGSGGDGVRISYLAGGTAYGSLSAPTSAGSGGGSGAAVVGMNGGGVIWIEATGDVTVDGTLTAGTPAGTGGSYSGGGAGGSIFVTCNRILGAGQLNADGRDATSAAGSGAGGRIAVIYNTVAQGAIPVPPLTFSAKNGTKDGTAPYFILNFDHDRYYSNDGIADIGTLYFPNSSFITRTNVYRYSGTWLAAGTPSSLGKDSLTVLGDPMYIPISGFKLTVTNSLTVPGELRLTNATVSIGGDLIMTNSGTFRMYGRSAPNPELTVNGNIFMADGASLHMYAGNTNDSTEAHGALVYVSGGMTLTNNCWVYPYSAPTNGGSVLFRMRNLYIRSANSGFNADGAGWERGGDGSVARNGLGLGYGYGNSGARSTGAGYGGQGGRSATVTSRGATYGSSNAPALPGSSGGGGGGTYRVGGRGGGLIWIAATNEIVLNGTMTANGGILKENNTAGYGGGGSGGGIYLYCHVFKGNATGLLRADGADSGYKIVCGAGGGGRIAVWRRPDRHFYQGSYSVTNGIGNTLGVNNSEVGTIVLVDVIIPKGTVFMFR